MLLSRRPCLIAYLPLDQHHSPGNALCALGMGHLMLSHMGGGCLPSWVLQRMALARRRVVNDWLSPLLSAEEAGLWQVTEGMKDFEPGHGSMTFLVPFLSPPCTGCFEQSVCVTLAISQ